VNQDVVFDNEDARRAWIQNWMNKADSNIHEMADEYARYVTFQDESKLAKVAIVTKRLLNVDRGLFRQLFKGEPKEKTSGIRMPRSYMVGEYVLPYPRVPANLLNRGLAYSPPGILKGALNLVNAAGEVESGNYRTGLLSLTRGFLGLGMTPLIWELAKLGILSGGDKDEDRKVREVKRQVTGEGRHQINLTAFKRYFLSGFDSKVAGKQKDDLLISYDWAQPLALSVAFAVNAEERVRTHGIESAGILKTDWAAQTAAGLYGSYGVIEDQPMMQGVKNLFRTYGEASGSSMGPLLNILAGVPASFVPGMVNNLKNYLDNDRKITYHPDSIAQTAVSKAVGRMPFVSEALGGMFESFKLSKAYKTLGKDRYAETYTQGNNSLFNVFFNPAFVSRYNPDPMALMLLKPYEETRRTDTLPKTQGPSVTMGGETFQLKTEDRAQMQRVMAGYLTRMMGEELKWRPKTPLGQEAQIERLVKMVDASGKQARGWFAQNKLSDYMSRAKEISGLAMTGEDRKWLRKQKAKNRYSYNPRWGEVEKGH
jgi:hypothetical protein